MHEGDDIVVFCLRNVKRLQRGVGVFEKDRPIAFADAHSLMGELHVTALVVQWAAGTGDEKIHDELPFPFHALHAAMLPEPAELRVFFHAIQEIVGDGEDGIIATEAFVEVYRAVSKVTGRPLRLVGVTSPYHEGSGHDSVTTRGCYRHMYDEAARIELVHSAWINYERAGDLTHLLALCSDDVEFWPPNAPPIVGHEEVAKYLNHPETAIRDIKVSDLQIRVSHGFAYLTAKYQTTFNAQDGQTATTVGSHLWILRNHASHWIVILVAWSVWAPDH